MSNVEIEDVLSSIRRLVSENASRARPGAPATPKDGEEVAAPDGGREAPVDHDALLLTPAQRVEEAAAPDVPPGGDATPDAQAEAGDSAEPDERALDASWEEVAGPERALWRAPETFEFDEEAEAEAEPEQDDFAEEGSDAPLQSRVEGLEAAFDDGGEYEPDGSEVADSAETFDWAEDDGEETVIDLSTPDVPTGRLHFKGEAPEADPPEVIELGPPEDAQEEAALPEHVEAPVDEEVWPEPEEDWTAPDLPRPDAGPAEAEAPLVFRSAHRGNFDAEPEEAPDAPQDNDDEEELAAYFAETDVAEDGAEAANVVSPDAWGDGNEAEDASAEYGDATLEGQGADAPDEAHEAALEGYVLGTEDGSGTAADDEADPWEDGTEGDDDLDEPEGGAHQSGALAPERGEAGAPALIDEDMLTDLVAEVVRAELRGRMGERITQNVRKLVRREIARALETRGIR